MALVLREVGLSVTYMKRLKTFKRAARDVMLNVVEVLKEITRRTRFLVRLSSAVQLVKGNQGVECAGVGTCVGFGNYEVLWRSAQPRRWEGNGGMAAALLSLGEMRCSQTGRGHHRL